MSDIASCNMKLDAKTGRFLPTPMGLKTPKMLEVEKRIGKSLEEDFQYKHYNLGWGQKKIAQSWGVKKNLVFFEGMRGGRRSWSQMLGLSARRIAKGSTATMDTSTNIKEVCEICGEGDVPLEGAHWKPHSVGGSDRRFNILRLCPNCHTKLDYGDTGHTTLARRVLLIRETKRLFEGVHDRDELGKELERVYRNIFEVRVSDKR